MNILKSKLLIAALCILISAVIVWQVSKYAESSKDVTKIIKLTTQVEPNVEIKENMIREVEAGKFNLPNGLINDRKDIIGKYSAETIYPDDILFPVKFKDKADMPDQFLYELKPEQVAVSVSIKTLAAGMSGKLMPGDIVSVLVYKKGDYQEGGTPEGEVVEYPDLKYVEIGAINNNKAQDLGVETKDVMKDESTTSMDTIIPATVTLLVNERQAKTLAMADNTGVIHIVFRGRGSAAADMLSKNAASIDVEITEMLQQEDITQTNYNSEDNELPDENTDTNNGTTDVDFNIE